MLDGFNLNRLQRLTFGRQGGHPRHLTGEGLQEGQQVLFAPRPSSEAGTASLTWELGHHRRCKRQ